jgi:hypothetical protein
MTEMTITIMMIHHGQVGLFLNNQRNEREKKRICFFFYSKKEVNIKV